MDEVVLHGKDVHCPRDKSRADDGWRLTAVRTAMAVAGGAAAANTDRERHSDAMRAVQRRMRRGEDAAAAGDCNDEDSEES